MSTPRQSSGGAAKSACATDAPARAIAAIIIIRFMRGLPFLLEGKAQGQLLPLRYQSKFEGAAQLLKRASA